MLRRFNTMFESVLPIDTVIDMITVKPLAEDEAKTKSIYKIKLETLFSKLTN